MPQQEEMLIRAASISASARRRISTQLFGCDCASCRRAPEVTARLLALEIDPDLDDSDDYEDSDDSDEYYDSDSSEEQRDIWYHGYKPRPVFHGDGPVYLGMELEVEAPDTYSRSLESYARKVRQSLGDVVYLQEDSSINYGFEVTTHPMSYSWAMENFAWDALEAMEKLGFRTHSDVGIHVHVSRAGFMSDCHLYRWMKFIYRNERQVSTLARRRYSQWASFAPEYRKQVKRYMKQEDYLRNGGEWGGYDNRYQAINPNNRNTLEVRVFASSLRPREVKAALAFVASTVEYTRDLDANKIIQGNGWAWSSYVEWLRPHDTYRPLTDELEALACVS